MPSGKVVIENLYKIFDPRPGDALALLKQGVKKETVFAQTGKVVGVNDVSFTVKEGEIFVLMGLSGSGKSTLIRLINRLVDPSDGKIFVDGQDVAKLTSRQLLQLRRSDMSMVFQSFALMPHRNVLDNTAFGLEIAGVRRAEREARAGKVLEQVGLGPYAKKYPHQLSGGMQQRVGLARALAVNPSLMLMDEAFSALDPLKRKEMQGLLLNLQSEQRRTIIFVSHDLEEALRIGNRIAIMEGGRLVQVGTPQEIIENPADDYVRAFFKSVDTSRYLVAADLMDSAGIPVLTKGQARGGQVAWQPWLAFVNQDRKWIGLINADVLAACNDPHQAVLPEHAAVSETTCLRDILPQLMKHPAPLAVLDSGGAYLGVITAASALRKISLGANHA
ncbi:glycine betaine/proline transport system ATP-binding protein [Janthinobacterium sp. CG_23.3]|uniref:quaternary amine ABC transporter ATP-binding protein n=1 Tax=unclassified Janthinobacterium TaxID=2610881 RepID=UPI00034636AE|nr:MULTISPECIES: glycine betaine/L-proline ABC transporter ATP-binding protein [unclassified Janthinobacterium]MEC5162037.1 glycine betaine/proline transport system ATP-binding protein [Janthinobacterium sp. CG_S6]